MGHYADILGDIADEIERGLYDGGARSEALSFGAGSRDSCGCEADGADDPWAVAWDLRRHLERWLDQPSARLGAMAELLLGVTDEIDARIRAGFASGAVAYEIPPAWASYGALRGFAARVLAGEEDNRIWDYDWEGDEFDSYEGSESELGALLCDCLDFVCDGSVGARVIMDWLRAASKREAAAV